MNPDTKISLVIPTYNRFDLLLECIQNVIGDPRIGEIVILDDASTDGSYERLHKYFLPCDKVVLRQNPTNLDCYRNKAAAARLATNQFMILFDSDNILPVAYVDNLYSMADWHGDTVYCPEFAEPHFNYTQFSGVRVTRHTVANFCAHQTFLTALNTCNCFVHRANWLGVFNPDVDPHTADSIYMNYRWLEAGNKLQIVPGLRYFHRVHNRSHFKLNNHKTKNFDKKVEKWLKELK